MRFQTLSITTIVLLLFIVSCSGRPVNTSGPGGNWTGESICTIKDSPCHDEQVIYTVTEPDKAGKLQIQADKVVNGQPQDMGTLDCVFDAKASTVVCQMPQGKWEFTIAGDKMTGTLTVTDGRLFRRISVARVK